MKTRAIIKLVRRAREHVEMKNCGFGRLGMGRTPPTFDDGRAVTEANVTEFIRERTKLWRESWILGPLADALILLEQDK